MSTIEAIRFEIGCAVGDAGRFVCLEWFSLSITEPLFLASQGAEVSGWPLWCSFARKDELLGGSTSFVFLELLLGVFTPSLVEDIEGTLSWDFFA